MMKLPFVVKNWLIGLMSGFFIGFCLCYLLVKAGYLS